MFWFKNLKSSGRYSSAQLAEIGLAVEQGWDIDMLSLLSDPHYATDQIYLLRMAIENGIIDKRRLSFLTNPKHTILQRKAMYYAIMRPLTFEQLVFISDKRYESKQILELCYGFEDGRSMDEVRAYSDPSLSPNKMQFLRLLYALGCTKEQVLKLADPMLSMKELNEHYELLKNESH